MSKLLKRKSSVKGLVTDLSNIQSSVGLNETLEYVPVDTASYINSAINVKNATELLDTEVKSLNDDLGAVNGLTTDAATVVGAINELDSELAAQITNSGVAIGNVQAELDATQTGAGLDTDGNYVANTSANYIASATSLKDATDKLDAQVHQNTNDIAAEVSRAQTAESTITTTFTDADTAINTRISNLEQTVATASSIRGAFDTAAGLEGLDEAQLADGYMYGIRSTGDVYVYASGLDSYDYVPADGSGENNGAWVGGFIIFGNITDITNAINAEADARSAQDDRIEAAVGLSADGDYQANVGTNYIGTATSMKDADEKLDAQVKANADAISAETTRATNVEDAINADLGDVSTLAETIVATTVVGALNELEAEKCEKSANLSDLADITVARSNIDVYSKSEVDTAISNQSNATKNVSATVADVDGTPKVVFTNAPVGGLNGVSYGVVRIFGVDGDASTYDEVEISLDPTDISGKTFIINSTENYIGLVAKAFISYNPSL
jgi:hypothetical protein